MVTPRPARHAAAFAHSGALPAAAAFALAALAALAAASLGACEFDRSTAPPGVELPVVHGVLNPRFGTQLILVERTLTGRVDVDTGRRLDRGDPIRTGGGDPISGATVVVFDARGDSAVAREDSVGPAGAERGTGVYRFVNDNVIACPPPDSPLQCLAIRPGERYRLRVVTPEGRVVAGATTVPQADPGFAFPTARDFDRDRDTVTLRWDAVPYARQYELRLESPFGPFFLLFPETEVVLPGTLRNIFAKTFPRVFIPGFTQRVEVAAVDTNFFDYYRTGGDPFTGTGLINRLDGGVGLFGAYVPLRTELLAVTAEPREPIEGRYARVRGAPQVDSLRLYVESREGALARLSGNWRGASSGSARPPGLIGTLNRDRVSIALLPEQAANDTTAVFSGAADADSLYGVVRTTRDGIGLDVVFRRLGP
jgi:hypothetical protein